MIDVNYVAFVAYVAAGLVGPPQLRHVGRGIAAQAETEQGACCLRPRR